MSKCISSHGEYSEHEPGDPCPWCGEYDMERIIAERDEALARIKAAKAEALREAAPLMHDFHDAAWLETQATEYERGDQR